MLCLLRVYESNWRNREMNIPIVMKPYPVPEPTVRYVRCEPDDPDAFHLIGDGFPLEAMKETPESEEWDSARRRWDQKELSLLADLVGCCERMKEHIRENDVYEGIWWYEETQIFASPIGPLTFCPFCGTRLSPLAQKEPK